MNAKELIKILKTLPPETSVKMSSDEEGNSIYDIMEVAETKMCTPNKVLYVLYPNQGVDYVQEDEATFSQLPEEEQKKILGL